MLNRITVCLIIICLVFTCLVFTCLVFTAFANCANCAAAQESAPQPPQEPEKAAAQDTSNEPPKEIITDQVRCFSTWDAQYLYLGFKVDCPDVRASSSAPNAPVIGDDAIEIFVETDNKHADGITDRCFSMIVSAANGGQFRVGTEDGKLEPVPVWTFKYGARVQGTLNNSEDIDMGYSVEVAIPWDIMKTTCPVTGDMMSLNVLIHRHGDKPGDFVSLSSKVKTQEQALQPSLWSNVVFAAHSFGMATTSLEKVLSAKYIVRAPLVDGIVGDKEWHRNTSFTVNLPMPEGFVYEAKFPSQKTVFTHYFLWYQANVRKAAPYSHISRQDNALQLQDSPAANAGPWFSYDRVQWHKQELSDIAEAGIDVVLPVYWGDSGNRAGFAAKGLDCMVSAMDELASEGKPHPMAAMFFDTSAMRAAYGAKPDLRDPEVQSTFYGMIKDFFDRIPREYRAVAQTGKPNAGQPGNIVFLYTSSFFSDFDSTFVQYCNERYEQDFGCPLIWIASEDYAPKAQGFDGFSTYGAGLGPKYSDNGRIRIASIGAGFDNSAVAAQGEARIRSRMGGQTYEQDWAAALEKEPHWVVCDGWNELHEASDLCASRQYGRTYIDATRANTGRFQGNNDFDAQYLRYDVPKVVAAQQFAQAQFVIRNIGLSPWRASDGYALAYRWYKNGRYYGESKIRRPIERDVFPGDTITVNMGIATVNAQGEAMPEGDCEMRFELIRLSDGKWFSSLGDQFLMVPVTIGAAPEWAASYLSCDAPVMLESSQSYITQVQVRNDGFQTWPKGIAKLGCSLYKLSNYTHDNSEELFEEVPIKPIRSLLIEDCKPGEIAEFMVDLNLTGEDGKPLPAWQQGCGWSYQLVFDIYNGESWLSELGAKKLHRTVDIFDADYGPRIVDCDIPHKIFAGQTLDVKVVVRNTGVRKWLRKNTKLGYHWYHVDGAEMLWDGPAVQIPQDLDPGWPTVVDAQVTTPQYDGQYVLVWDVMVDDQWLSTGPLSRGGDILPIFVEVTNGKLEFADLTDIFDTVATSPDTDRNSGDFDGTGASFPAEFMPPDAPVTEEISRIYPTGYNWLRQNEPDGRISFLYADKVAGTRNAVTCRGQKVAVPNTTCTALHVLAASVAGDAQAQFTINYAGGDETSAVQISDWSTGPAHEEKIGCAVRHRHTHGGDDIAGSCYLYHYTIPLDSSRKLTGITLPSNESIRITAITLERTSLPPLSVQEPPEEKA